MKDMQIKYVRAKMSGSFTHTVIYLKIQSQKTFPHPVSYSGRRAKEGDPCGVCQQTRHGPGNDAD